MRDMLIDAQTSHLVGHINKHKANVEILLTNPVGVGEHSDVMDAIEKELEEMAKYQDHIDMIDKYF